MRIAIFSDVHGNTLALDAVLADIASVGGVDAHWFVGDAAMIGFDPVGAVERLQSLPNLVTVRGNGDRRLATDPNTVREVTNRILATAEPAEASIWRSVLADSEWTRDLLKAAGRYEWVAALPLEQRLQLPDGTRVLLVHAAPGTDEGSGIQDRHSDDDLRGILAGAEADLVFVGHTHRPLDRTVDGTRVVNLGSLSNPPDANKRAKWSLLVADAQGYTLERREVDYDIAAVCQRLLQDQVPAWEYIMGYFAEMP